MNFYAIIFIGIVLDIIIMAVFPSFYKFIGIPIRVLEQNIDAREAGGKLYKILNDSWGDIYNFKGVGSSIRYRNRFNLFTVKSIGMFFTVKGFFHIQSDKITGVLQFSNTLILLILMIILRFIKEGFDPIALIGSIVFVSISFFHIRKEIRNFHRLLTLISSEIKK